MPAKKTTDSDHPTGTIPVGKKAPAFSLKDGNGKTVKLSDFKGRKVVLYFYPKDLTPGCTTEACGFRDEHVAIEAAGAVVLGVSTDEVDTHRKFSEKFSLPFQLLSDPDHSTIEKYGAWVEKSMYGKKYWGVSRITYIIDEEGKVLHLFSKVKPDGHSREILAALKG